MNWLMAPVTEGATYRAMAYFVLGLGLGIAEFTLIITGFALGLGLLVTIVGIPVLVVTLLVARAMASLERQLAVQLLDAPMPRHRHLPAEPAGVWVGRLRRLLADRRTWSELAFLMLRMPMAILDLAFVLTLVGLALSGIAYPVAIAFGAQPDIAEWQVDTVAEGLIFLPISLLFLAVGPRLIVAWSKLSRGLATRLLGRVAAAEIKREVVDVLARRNELDAFSLLDDLELRLGTGPFLSPTRVEAALLALESNGHISARRTGSRTVYALP